MRIPGRATSWAMLAGLLVLAGSAATISVVVLPTGTHREAVPPPPARSPTPTISPPSPQPAPPPEQLLRVAFLNAKDGYGLFDESNGGQCVLAVASTKDAGASFSNRSPIAGTSCNGPWPMPFSFDDHGDGFVGSSDLFTTHDSGSTWTKNTSFSPVVSVIPLGYSVWALHGSCQQPSSMQAPQVCNFGIEQSSDGGLSWHDFVLPGSGGTTYYTDLLRTSTSSAFVVTWSVADQSAPPSVGLLVTTNGGRSWQERSRVPCIGAGGTADLTQAPNGTLWMVCGGQPGAGNQIKSVARSFDGGRSWVQGACPIDVNSPSATFPTCLPMSGGYLGDAVALSSTTAFFDGGRNFLQETQDGGASWHETVPTIGDGDVGVGPTYFVNAKDGWVVYSNNTYAVLWHTGDGGNHWSQIWPVDIEKSNCSSSQLSVSTGPALSSPIGYDGLVIRFTNVSSTSCELGGYPTVVLVDSDGHEITAIENSLGSLGGVTNGGPLPLVQLQPGGVASTVVESQSQPDPGQPPCTNYEYLLVTAPGGGMSVRLPAVLPGLGRSLVECRPTPFVHEVVPGANGSA